MVSRAVALAACLAFVALALRTALVSSGVADELGGHMAAGLLYWRSGSYSGGIANFPLGQLLGASLVFLLERPHALFTEQSLVWFRLPNIVLGLGLVLIVWRFARDLYGPAAGAVAALLCALSPTLIAHSSLATLDLPIAFFFSATLYGLWRYLRRPGWLPMLATSLAAGAALATKIQGLLLIPLLVVILAAACLGRAGPRPQAGPDAAPDRLRPAWAWLLLVAVPFLVVHLVYRHVPFAGGEWLPPQYLGALRVKLEHGAGGLSAMQTAYLAGRWSSEGWWYYFPIALLAKTPVATLVLVAAGLLRRPQPGSVLFVLLPAAAWLVLGMAGSVNIGVRHVLGVYPFLFLLAGAGGARLLSSPRRGLLLGTLAALLFVDLARGLPHPLSFFNLAVGGPARGHRLLVDSNLDWGQDDAQLRRHVARRGLDYQICPDPFRPAAGHLLINANAYYGIYGGGGPASFAWLKGLEPVDRVAYTWFEFDVSQQAAQLAVPLAEHAPPSPLRPWNPELSARDLDLALESVARYLDLLRAQAHDVTGGPFRNGLAWCYALSARYAEALDLVRERLAEQPTDETALGIGGEILVQWKLGILRLKGDEYLHLPGADSGALAPMDEPRISVEEAAAAAERAGLSGALLDLHRLLAARLQARGQEDAARSVMARAALFGP